MLLDETLVLRVDDSTLANGEPDDLHGGHRQEPGGPVHHRNAARRREPGRPAQAAGRRLGQADPDVTRLTPIQMETPRIHHMPCAEFGPSYLGRAL